MRNDGRRTRSAMRATVSSPFWRMQAADPWGQLSAWHFLLQSSASELRSRKERIGSCSILLVLTEGMLECNTLFFSPNINQNQVMRKLSNNQATRGGILLISSIPAAGGGPRIGIGPIKAQKQKGEGAACTESSCTSFPKKTS